MTRPARERMVFSAAQLIRTQGVSGTGMRDVVAHAEAPRGSLQHYFPGGKEQLVDEALAWAGSYAARKVRRYAAALTEPTPGKLFEAMAGQWREEFTSAGFAAGCPLVAATADSAAASERLRAAVSRAFEGWQEPVAGELRRMGVPAARSASLALLMISALEGAIVLARAHQDLAPLDAVTRELAPLLDAAAG
ncbi:TetR/AcrR family transcriptional regulator [Amycolatopsis acidiphila]|uniref:TetR/AcrR family transcriptional regulator n=1 Tax=Amycolatopsis acidiphila TaxID=715473 RepID=A0A558AGC3_9PSEU|nr:TetR/AcrR family transcriptional regulator [Amycolatopsis acidiphila]TVT23320.1 TetR/AcrR family transcriptional regulator [Amycolatopsis acidiphila]UIJ56547.1 TetR/AcrR family transcriptional regulator [Amycolatopsis acidiphila]GHG66713.1 TetR family transcriptional regulator [Amycolatopsis acidiphila]